jgi:glucose/arabinose dehydrogenase
VSLGNLSCRGYVASAIIVATATVLLVNVGGWRVRLWARLTRVENWPEIAPSPADFQPKLPAGFKVSVFAAGFTEPRWLAVASNGDVFVADSAAGKVIVLHGLSAKGEAESRSVFADHLNLPFGIAFHRDYVYIADTNEILRFLYDPASSKRLGAAERILDLPGLGYHQHWTRSLAFSRDGQDLYVSVGSQTNVSIEPDPRRAAILVMDPDGKNMRLYASGLRNAVGIGYNPDSGNLWASVNERDDIGDDAPSDYFTHVIEGGFYGWPYVYDGSHADDRVSSKADLAAKTITPDVLLGAHVAPLQCAFYDKESFPSAYRRGAFIAEHGSWNRRIRSGYQVVFVPFRDGHPAGEAIPFFSGFVPDPAGKTVYGRMVGVAVAADGALLVSDDAGKLIWRVSYEPGN